MSRFTGAALSCLVVALAAAAAPPASAHHSAFATASLALDPPSATCQDSERSHRSRCDGSRVARVTWSVACAYKPYTRIRLWAVRAGGGAPIPLTGEDAPDLAASGMTAVRLDAGAMVFATATVDCYTEGDEGDGGSVPEHSARATSPATAEALIPPRLTSVEVVENRFCNVSVSPQRQRRVVQAGWNPTVSFTLEFNDRSLLAAGRSSRAGVRRTWLVANGAGTRYRKHPLTRLGNLRTGPNLSGAFARPTPRRGGRIELWAEIGGHRTNTLSLPVLPRRC